MLIRLILVIISQHMCISKHQLVHLKYMQYLFVSYASVKLWVKTENLTKKNYKIFPWTVTSVFPMKSKYATIQ